ncbi:MAG: rod shape-determining protein MreC [Betaproteobacteria bacterium]|nr:rod shape-determining protein MreC [Betaproteobacteria bacterium]
MQASAPPIFKRGPSLVVRLTFFSILSVVLLVADARFHYLEEIRSALSVVLFPLQEAAAMPATMLRRTSDFFVTQASLYRENERLKRERLLSEPDSQRLRMLESENQQLRRLLNMPKIPDRERTVADIIYESRDPFSRKIVIDRGTMQGVKAGQAVVDYLGVIGQVTRAYPFVSEVTLLTDKSQSVPVQNARSGLRSVTFGVGHDGAVELRYMPVNADIQNGDLFVTSGIDGTYPPGIPVAVVTNIERSTAAFAKIICVPSAAVGHYTRVAVLSDPPPRPENPLGKPSPTPAVSKKE